MNKRAFFLILTLIAYRGLYGQKNTLTKLSTPKYSAYLFTYFTGIGTDQESIRFAISNNGFNYIALNGNQPVLNSNIISSTGGVRDPHIYRGADGKSFYMVATDMNVAKNGWGPNNAMVLLKSSDLVHWSSKIVRITSLFPEFSTVNRVWAPQTIYDPNKKKYLIYWSMRSGTDPDKIYYAYANSDFTGFESHPKQLFYSPGNFACIDGDIQFKGGLYYLFFKTEDQMPGIKNAVSSKLTEGYKIISDKYLQQTDLPVEGAGTFKLNNADSYILMYDVYKSGKYQFTKSNDLKHFTVIDQQVSMNFHPRHGTVMPITSSEAEALIKRWMKPGDIMQSVQSIGIRKQNMDLDTVARNLTLSVSDSVKLSRFNPGFLTFPGLDVTPKGYQDFSKGPVNYTVKIQGRANLGYKVSLAGDHNPVINGFYADPEILYAKKTGKFYIYPTSDGFTNWSGNYFKAFSSSNLVNWLDEGVILDLNKDVSWAKTAAWAPCIIEKTVNGNFKYFYYFVAAQKIGVAVSDSPTGPFKDSGKPLIDHFPEGVTRGQQIDPAVFTDPKTGKTFLYWGNAYMAGAELNDDMISIRPGTTKLLTPDETYTEGTYVFYRDGKYYFMWSKGDTRSPDYLVRYGIADSPLGKIVIPNNNLVIAKDEMAGIYGTGHNAVIQIPGKDEWYLVYHRFNFPNGINMGEAAGYNREVCIDKLEFNADGSIKPVKPTKNGIHPIVFKPNNN